MPQCALAIGCALALLSACTVSTGHRATVTAPPKPPPATSPADLPTSAGPPGSAARAVNPAPVAITDPQPKAPPAGTTRVAGKVLTANGKPLAGATVTLESTTSHTMVSTTTRTDGSFMLSPVPPGDYILKATIAGFDVVETTVTASLGAEAMTVLQLGALPPAKPSWNSWATEELAAGEPAPATATFLVGYSYRVTFDLAGIDYGDLVKDSILSAEPDPSLQGLLATKASLTLLAKPFLRSEGLTFAPGQGGQAELQRQVVDLDRMRQPAKYLNELSDADRRRLPKLADHLHAARFEVLVKAEKPGRSVVALALWDADTRQPLDFLSFPINAVDPAASAPVPAFSAVHPPPFGRRLQSGLRTLLTTPSSITADAGIGIFELDESGANTVVFLGPGGVARSWSPRRSIREFVSDEGPGEFGLTRQLEGVHCPSPSPPSCREDYSQVSRFFSAIVFSAPDSKGENDAHTSLDELSSLVDSKPFPVVATRFIDASGASRPIPLGLLGLSGRLLGNLAYVTQPLPVDRPDPATSCIHDFATVIPKTLGLGNACQRAVLDDLLRPIVPPSSPFISSFDELQRFLAGDAGSAPAEGLLLVAHHSDGFLSFTPEFRRALAAEEIRRRYSPGSAAILIGCSVGGLSPLNRSLPLVSTLNEHGVDAIIFSPFGVNAELGSRLAVHFSAAVEASRRSKTETSLFELYQQTFKDTRADDAVQPFLGELAEFSIAGSGNLKLCAENPGVATASPAPLVVTKAPGPTTRRPVARRGATKKSSARRRGAKPSAPGRPASGRRPARRSPGKRVTPGSRCGPPPEFSVPSLGGGPIVIDPNGPIKTGIGPGSPAGAGGCSCCCCPRSPAVALGGGPGSGSSGGQIKGGVGPKLLQASRGSAGCLSGG